MVLEVLLGGSPASNHKSYNIVVGSAIAVFFGIIGFWMLVDGFFKQNHVMWLTLTVFFAILLSLLKGDRSNPPWWRLFLASYIFTIISAFLAYKIFHPYESISMVFFTVLALAPFMYNLISNEEFKGEHLHPRQFFSEYGHLFKIMAILLLGVTTGFLVLYLSTSVEVSQDLFEIQTGIVKEHYTEIAAQGNAIDCKTQQVFTKNERFTCYLQNNFQVLGISLLLAFMFGFGAITVIVWNASTLAVAMGNFFVERITYGTSASILTWSYVRYFIHGIPEILAYLTIGMAGGMLSMAIVNHKHRRAKVIFLYCLALIVLAILLIVFAGWVEAYITPKLY
jgi:uncharacterized membrane protein SpoIIM required for sporulation